MTATIHQSPLRRHTAATRQRPSLAAGRSAPVTPAGRSTYPTHLGLIAAICVSWTIALVAGTALIWSMT